jgi:hypothetical protein
MQCNRNLGFGPSSPTTTPMIITYCECMCVCVSVCSLNYPACNARAPYCHLWPVQLYHIFPHKRAKKKFTEHKMCVFVFFTTLIWNVSHYKENSVTYYHNSTCFFMKSIRYYCHSLTKLKFSRQIKKTFSRPELVFIRSLKHVVWTCSRNQTRIFNHAVGDWKKCLVALVRPVCAVS